MDVFLFFPSIQFESVFVQSLVIWLATGFGTLVILIAGFFVLFHNDTYQYKENPIMMAKAKLFELVTVFGSVFLSWALVVILKWIISSPRPFLYFDAINPLFYYGGYDSFPSGHATFFSALATALYFYHPRIGRLYFVIAIIIGTARVISGIHFPIDIFAGFALGILSTFAIHHMLKEARIVNK